MSHFALAVISDGTKTLEDLMAPYQENNTDNVPRKYLEFVSEDIGPYEANYNEGISSLYYDPDANPMQLLTAYDERFRVKGFRGSYGTNTHSVPDSWRRVDVPINLLYPTFDDYMRECEGYRDGKDPETNQYGYWENPNAKWDWYTVGGRWKKWADDTIGGCALRVGDIRFDSELESKKATRWYEHADKESFEFRLVSKGLSMEEYAELCSNLYFRACIHHAGRRVARGRRDGVVGHFKRDERGGEGMGRKLCGTIPEQSRPCDNTGRLPHMTRAERTHEILYSCDSREELASRIAELEEFAQDLYEFAELYDEEKGPRQWYEIRERMQKLGIEVPK